MCECHGARPSCPCLEHKIRILSRESEDKGRGLIVIVANGEVLAGCCLWVERGNHMSWLGTTSRLLARINLRGR